MDEETFSAPMDTINAMKGKEVTITLRGGKELTGQLVSFDLQQNVGIKVKGELLFLQGGHVLTVQLK